MCGEREGLAGSASEPTGGVPGLQAACQSGLCLPTRTLDAQRRNSHKGRNWPMLETGQSNQLIAFEAKRERDRLGCSLFLLIVVDVGKTEGKGKDLTEAGSQESQPGSPSVCGGVVYKTKSCTMLALCAVAVAVAIAFAVAVHAVHAHPSAYALCAHARTCPMILDLQRRLFECPSCRDGWALRCRKVSSCPRVSQARSFATATVPTAEILRSDERTQWTGWTWSAGAYRRGEATGVQAQDLLVWYTVRTCFRCVSRKSLLPRASLLYCRRVAASLLGTRSCAVVPLATLPASMPRCEVPLQAEPAAAAPMKATSSGRERVEPLLPTHRRRIYAGDMRAVSQGVHDYRRLAAWAWKPPRPNYLERRHSTQAVRARRNNGPREGVLCHRECRPRRTEERSSLQGGGGCRAQAPLPADAQSTCTLVQLSGKHVRQGTLLEADSEQLTDKASEPASVHEEMLQTAFASPEEVCVCVCESTERRICSGLATNQCSGLVESAGYRYGGRPDLHPRDS